MNQTNQIVMACLDDSSLSEAVCDYAVWMARRIEHPLKLFHTIDHHHEKAEIADLSGTMELDEREHLLEELTNRERQQSKLRIQNGKQLLQNAKQRVADQGIEDPLLCLQHGSLIDSLVEFENDIRVLVVGARGKVHDRHAGEIGAKLESLIRSLHRPILVAYQEFIEPKTIMIAYDGSRSSQKVIELVANPQFCKGLTCHLVHVAKKGVNNDMLEKPAHIIRSGAEIEVICATLNGKPEQALCDYQVQHDIDMTIMGAFSHSRLHDLLLGSFTHKMLLKTNKSLLLLR
ncbi:MAG: universal stress protein [Gammaproteobacteria bacterium]|nr:universal stress protein [Gammaproteobacteria bacterium]